MLYCDFRYLILLLFSLWKDFCQLGPHFSNKILRKSTKILSVNSKPTSRASLVFLNFLITKMLKFLVLFAIISATVYANHIPERCIQNSVSIVSCDIELDETHTFYHPDDCNLFYYCVDTNSTPSKNYLIFKVAKWIALNVFLFLVCRKCPDELHFNSIKKVCDFPVDAGCRAWICII